MRKLFTLCAYIMPTATTIRDQRRATLLEILASQAVARQSDFVRLLHERGVEATQSSISRDLRELGVAKLGEGYAQLTAQDDDNNEAIPFEFIRSFAPAGDNLTVVKTATGAASRVALFLDRSSWPEIVGTVSGDDTIFIATRNAREQKNLLGRFRNNLTN
jgi:transcriptional regulator of arginine metabolism